MILPSLTTILVCFLEMLPLGRQMSFSSTRPMVISSDSKSSRWVAPPFSVRITLKGICAGPPWARTLIENGEFHRITGFLVQPARVVDQVLDPLHSRRHHPRRHVDGELRLVVDEIAALEQFTEDGNVPEQRNLGDFL